MSHEANNTIDGFDLGLFFPPAIIGAVIIGGGLGALAGDLTRHHEEGIADALEDVMPVGTSAVVAVVEDRYSERVDKAKAKALKEALRQAEKQSRR
jgi:uncharacterized membrane protein